MIDVLADVGFIVSDRVLMRQAEILAMKDV